MFLPINYRLGWTLLHQAAKDGNLKVYQAILEKVTDKNPKDYYFGAPFHLASLYGHINLCSFISDYLPKNSELNILVGHLHEAAEDGNLKVYQAILRMSLTKIQRTTIFGRLFV